MFEEKIIPFEQAPAFFEKLRLSGKRIVQCHGTFDLIHPGHLYHLEEARAKGDILVVTVTSEPHVNKGPGRPFFNDQLRSKTLSALGFVDYVVLIPFPAAVEAIECVRPHIYCKGREYAEASNDVTGNILDEVAAVERVGGQTEYLGSVVFSSTKLLNNFFNHLPEPVKALGQKIASRYRPEDFRKVVDDFSKLRVLVLGDSIFDRYSFVKVQGLTSKNRIISGRFLREQTDPGGALAVARHLRQFTPHVKMISLVGADPWIDPLIRQHFSPSEDLFVRDPRVTTIVKQRFVEPVADGKELGKLFSVNFIDAEPPPPEVITRILENLERAIREVDLVAVMDFGHGLMVPEVREFVQKNAPFMALNCQTNSNNHGFNIINQQYRRCDCFALDEPEMLLACSRKRINFAQELNRLQTFFGAQYAWLTRGAVETIGLDPQHNMATCPPLQPNVTDTVGAGDAFFSVVALAAAQGVPIECATFLGQLAGSQAVNIVGNSQPISKSTLLKSGLALINY
jgi:cytidyltransferase-like protein